RGRAPLSATDACPRGAPGRLPGAAAARVVGADASATDPHAWHSPHRPTHLEVSQPHSLHRKLGRDALAMGGTLGHGSDRLPYDAFGTIKEGRCRGFPGASRPRPRPSPTSPS